MYSVPISMFKSFCYDDQLWRAQLAVPSTWKALAPLMYTCQDYELVTLSDKFQKYFLQLENFKASLHKNYLSNLFEIYSM